jgi:hypothetical protein
MPGIIGDGVHGSRDRRFFRASGLTGAALPNRWGNDSVLQRLVLCTTGEPQTFNKPNSGEVMTMRVERERELRRRRKRREKAHKARRKAALMKVGKWPPAPTKA